MHCMCICELSNGCKCELRGKSCGGDIKERGEVGEEDIDMSQWKPGDHHQDEGSDADNGHD